MTIGVNTYFGVVEVEPNVALDALRVGDEVLGLPDPVDQDRPRTLHRVTKTLGEHHVPAEDPGFLDRLLAGGRFERLVAGERVEGVLVEGQLVDGGVSPGLFALDTTPVLDRVA